MKVTVHGPFFRATTELTTNEHAQLRAWYDARAGWNDEERNREAPVPPVGLALLEEIAKAEWGP